MTKIQDQGQEKPPTPYKGYKTIRFSIDQTRYAEFMHDCTGARTYIDDLVCTHPEIFPAQITDGYRFHGKTEVSAKLGLRQRRVQLHATGEVYTLAPSFVMPYISGTTETVEKALFLLRFHVPYWAIAHVFGRDENYWYRLQCSLGRFSVVGTTVAHAEALPQDLVADEKHTRLRGQKAYVAMKGHVLDLQHHPAGYAGARVVFIRRTSQTGSVTVLGHRFAVDATWCGRLVRCEVLLSEGMMRIYRLRRRAPAEQPLLAEVDYALPRRRFRA